MTTTLSRADASAALATPSAMSRFAAILRPRVGQRVWIDSIRDELDAAGITGQTCGLCFSRAAVSGWIHLEPYTRVSTEPSARGRRVSVWLISAVPAQRVGK